jgi:hypothetical protein
MELYVWQDFNYWNREKDVWGISDFIIPLEILENLSLLILVVRRVHARALVILLVQGLCSPKFNSRLCDLFEAK